MIVPQRIEVYLIEIDQELPRHEAITQAKRAVIPETISYSAKGKPLHPDGHHALSISHSLNWLAMAVGPLGVPLGVDIEEKEAQAERLLERYSTAEERQLLQKYGMLPIELWTAKEAVYKAYSDMVNGGITQVKLCHPTLYTFSGFTQEVHTLYLEDKDAYLSLATSLPFELL